VLILVTAGPTREPVDPVRFLSNRSSGRMGYETAAAFAERGHRVLLVSGPTALEVPEGVDFLPVETAEEMYDAVERNIGRAEIAVFTAAVADYRPAQPLPEKLAKAGEALSLSLLPTKDILGSARRAFGFTGTLIGFAAETSGLEEKARRKLTAKGCDLVVANDVSQPGIGFDSADNEVLLVYPSRTEHPARASKHELARLITKAALDLHAGRSAPASAPVNQNP
jgi:phosphopantothenoylcysteine synthetase/decarboxylase